MKLIDYSKYKKESPRASIWYALLNTLFCGFFLGMAAMQFRLGWDWMRSLAMAFSSGILALRNALIAVYSCPPSMKTSQPDGKTVISTQ
jgi:hypothetical protein